MFRKHKMFDAAEKFALFLVICASNLYQIDSEPLLSEKILSNKTNEKLTVYHDEDGRSSLVFVFDTTGSMHNDLKQLKEGAEMILNTALEENDVIADFVFVPFHDPAVGPATVTQDKEVFKSALNIIQVYGGGDCPEKSLSGIQLALNVSRPRSHVYVFTDATASDHRLVGKVLDAVQRKQSQVVFVLTGHCNDLDRPSYKVYQQIAAASSGQIFNLNKTNVHKVLDFVRSSIKGRTVNLESAVNPPGYNHSQGIPVDSTLSEVTVSISGSKPQIKVKNPRGEEVNGPPQLITTLDLAEIVIVKVLQPEPGNWTIMTGSEDSYSVKVVGASNLTFHHGFSVSSPGSLAETSHRPLQGAYNHLMIALTQADRPVHINYAEIQSLDGKTLFEIPLKEVDKDRKVYLTEAFLPPDEFFYIAINGRDEYNQDLRRIGATAIQAKTPDVPYLTVPQKIEARIHERVLLRCQVESLVPITVFWAKYTERIQDKVSSLQSTAVDYVIEDLREENAGEYRCVATNVAGNTQAQTTVVMLVDPPVLKIEPFNKTVQMGDKIDVVCTAKSDSVLLKFDLYYNGVKIERESELNYVEGSYFASKRESVHSVTEKNTGIYTCIAENKGGGESSISTTIIVQSNPIAQILGPHTIIKPIHTTIQLVCRTENADQVVWTSHNNSVVKKMYVNGSVVDMYDVIDASEDGVWSCMAVRGDRKAIDSVEITVLIKPEVSIEGDRNISIVNGSSHTISCLIRAKPQPRILWHRETEDFLNNTITLLSPNLYKSELILNSSKEAVNGTYFCIGENSEGIGQDNVVVTVRRPMTLVQGFTDIPVDLYSQVELQCQVDAYPPPQITWYHNSTDLHTTDSIIRLSQDNTTLFILRVDFKELGLYSCEADNGFEKMRVDGSLTADDLETPILAKDPAHITTQKGNTTKLTCRVMKGKPEPVITWRYKKNASEIFNPLPYNVVLTGDNVLKILRADANNTGIYRCIAENAIGSDFHDITLKVLYPPQFPQNEKEMDDKPVEVKEGERVTFSCQARGLPPPIVIWSKDNMPVAYSKNVYLTDDNELIISKANEYDTGLYTCNVTSALGSLQRNFTLIVYVPPVITPPDIEPALEVLEGQLVELPCTARGVPKPEVVWLQNGALVAEDRKYIDEFGLRFVANLTDFGEYTCIAKSKYGSTSVNYTIFIWVAPYIDPPLKTTINTLLGVNITLNCDATGFPIPRIFWQFRGQTLTENNTDLSHNDVGNVYVTNASSKHDGIYTCIAENFVGIAKKEIILNVNEPPKILEDNFSGSYVATSKDSEIALSCTTTGKPKPFVAWVKDDLHYLDKDSRYDIDIDGTLTIKAPSEELSGLYTCVAKNSVGRTNRTVTVKIYPLLQRMQADEPQTTISVVEGTNTSIKCPVQASDSGVVKWYKDAKLISEGQLQILNISRQNTSSYACVVSNEVGSSYSKVHINVEWPPRFTGEGWSESIEVIRGDDWYFDCGVDANPIAKIKWLFNSKPLLRVDKYRLKLLNIQFYHIGVYKCVVNNTHGTITRQFALDVLVPPFISEFEFLDVQLNEGSNATLECNAKGSPPPEIKWTFNNTNWHLQNSTLTSTNLTTASEGLFTCVAMNKAGSARLVYRVQVVVIARVEGVVLYRGGGGESVEGGVQVAVGSHNRLSCVASGNPIPKVQWIRNGVNLAQNTKDISYADIKFDVVKSEDAGLYSCLAVNEGGMDERMIKLDIVEPPKILQNLFPNDNDSSNVTYMEVISGQSFYLHCHPYGNPAPSVYWFRDGQPLRFFDDTMVSTDYGEVLEVKSADFGQSANYTCVAKNSVGQTSQVYLVDVLVPPRTPKDATQNVTTRVSRPLNLTCPVQGSPLPTVTWFKHPYSELGGGRVSLYNNNYTLLINSTDVEDSGKYSCIMTNKVGTTEVSFNVIVEQPPYIAGKVAETLVILLGRSVVLKCQAGGNPAPETVWLKDNQKLTSNIHAIPNGSAVVIWSARSSHGGQYVCVAVNDAGTARARYDVILQVPGKWSSWSQWSLCNVTCGLGYQTRARSCRYVDDYNVTYDKSSDYLLLDKSTCKGPNNEKRKCHMPACEEEETQHWSPWSKWSKCSATCGVGTQLRTRRCRSRAPCFGDNVQLRKCPDLPTCSGDQMSKTDEFTGDTFNDSSPYIPEAVFEMQPDIINPDKSPDVEEVYIKPDSTHPASEYAVEVTDNLDGSHRGPCESGFKFNYTTQQCEDIDECLFETNQCHSTQLCVNTLGAYRCACTPGFTSLGAGQRCLDINECSQDTHGCEYACVNVAGGYVCACAPHMRLAADKHTCVTPSSSFKNIEELNGNDKYLSTSDEFPARYNNNKRNNVG